MAPPAGAALRLLGRREEEGALRDAHFFRSAAEDPGPAGNLLLAWRRLASRTTGLDEAAVRPVAEHLDLKWDDALAEVLGNVDDLAASSRPAPLLAAELAAELYRARPDAELLAFWLADALLAKQHRWPASVPLLMGQVNSAAFKIDQGRRRVRPGGEGWGRAVLVAYCMAAAEACDVGADLAGRAAHLVEVSPKLRARSAGEVVKLLLEDDAVPLSRSGTGLTDRALVGSITGSAARSHPNRGHGAVVNRLSSTVYARRGGRHLGQRRVARRHRRPARQGHDHRWPAQSNTRRPVHLRDDQILSEALRARHPPRPARLGSTRGRGLTRRE